MIDYSEFFKYFEKQDEKVTMRVNREDAHELLLKNIYVFRKHNPRYFIIRDLGLGVYEIGLREEGKENTFFSNEYWVEERKWTTKY